METLEAGVQINGEPEHHQTYKVSRRRKTRQVVVGGIKIGGDAPISVQTMTKTKTDDVAGTVGQIKAAVEAGCDIVRVTVNDKEAADAMKEIVRQSPVPIVADIHFNHVFALKAIEAGVAKVRLNPGNIGSKDRIRQVLTAAKDRGIPIRIGVNSGSLEEDILQKHGYPTAEALFEAMQGPAKLPYNRAWELVRGEWAFLPDEED